MNKLSPMAVIDLGSNTTKMSVITIPNLKRIHHSIRYTRIAKGMVKGLNCLSEESIESCIQAINGLIAEAEKFNVVHYSIVATSAVRDAENKEDFVQRIKLGTGLKPRILSGDEEATLIGMGTASDPILSDLEAGFTVFDLGGGSLECIHYEAGHAKQVVSLPLGAVRMTETYVSNPRNVIPFSELDRIYEETSKLLKSSSFNFSECSNTFIGTGGAFTVLRSIFAAKKGKDLSRSSPIIAVSEMGNLFSLISNMNFEARCEIPGLSKERADILPVALSIMLSVSEIAGIENFTHSFYNLSFGLAAEWKEACGL